MGAFLTPLELEYIDGHLWRVTKEFEYHLGAPDGVEIVSIPVGFVTDFASIPRALWNILPPTGSYGKAAVVHDWLYQHRTVDRPAPEISAGAVAVRLVDRAEADHILLEGMQVLGTGLWTRQIIYRGVRLGGMVTWNRYRKEGR